MVLNDTVIVIVCAIILNSTLSIIFFRKKKIITPEISIYSLLIIINFISLLIQILTGIITPMKNGSISTMFMLKLYFLSMLFWLILFTVYTLIISVKEQIDMIKYKKVFVYMLFTIFIFSIPIVFLPLKIDEVAYSVTGPCFNYLMALSAILDIIIIIVLVSKYKTIVNKRYVPIFIFLVLGMVVSYIQYLNPNLLISTAFETYIILIMYFTIENPDVKLLEKMEIAREQAEKANRAKSDFLSSMSHEIRTPLNAIVGLSEDIASYEDRVPKEVVEDSEDIRNASQTLLEIVGNILDISKIESDKLEIVENEYEFKKEIVSMAHVTCTRIGDKPINFSMNIAEDIPYTLIGDKVHVKGVINNLLTNAFKYTNSGYVDFTVKCINQNNICNLIITVKDSGIGIKKENIERLFHKFDRLDVEKNTTTEGTGLGLAITKQLVEMMGGKINVQSQFGSGSIFVINLPQKIGKLTPDVNTYDSVISKAIVRDYSGKRILIVDDNKLNIKVAKKALNDFNFVIDEAYNGQECLDKINTGYQYDLILMDIMMPVMSGETAMKNLKAIEGFNTPVIALTADAIAGAKERYLSAGFNDYIAKPFNRDQIKEKLDRVFCDEISNVEDRFKDAPTYIMGADSLDDIVNI